MAELELQVEEDADMTLKLYLEWRNKASAEKLKKFDDQVVAEAKKLGYVAKCQCKRVRCRQRA